MSTRLYKITRTGAQHVRWEWPNGEPVKGPRVERASNGRRLPKVDTRKGGEPIRVTYGAHRVDRNTGLPVIGVRSTIRLTAEGAKALAHMDLELVSGSAEVKAAEPAATGEVRVTGLDPDKLYSGKDVQALVGAINVEAQSGSRVIVEPAQAGGEAGSGGDKSGSEPDPKAKVPEDWRSLSESRQRGLAAKISGQPKDDITAAQAVSIIEAHVAAGGSNTG